MIKKLWGVKLDRVVKFRGFAEAGRWVYGNLVQARAGYSTTEKFYIVEKTDSIGWEDYFHAISLEVLPESIGQFTGLHDKNGKEIYEGDIIKYQAFNSSQYTFIGVVEYHLDGYALKCIQGNKESMIGEYFAFSIFDDGSFKLRKGEIIGNSFENSELLEVKND